jgi:hypothetical protein
MHQPTSKLVVIKKKAPRLIEGTMGNLTDKEKDAICLQIQRGWVNGNIYLGETYSLVFNLISTRVCQDYNN